LHAFRHHQIKTSKQNFSFLQLLQLIFWVGFFCHNHTSFAEVPDGIEKKVPSTMHAWTKDDQEDKDDESNLNSTSPDHEIGSITAWQALANEVIVTRYAGLAQILLLVDPTG
jgi:hypothetical protein